MKQILPQLHKTTLSFVSSNLERLTNCTDSCITTSHSTQSEFQMWNGIGNRPKWQYDCILHSKPTLSCYLHTDSEHYTVFHSGLAQYLPTFNYKLPHLVISLYTLKARLLSSTTTIKNVKYAKNLEVCSIKIKASLHRYPWQDE